ncbi:50S ribosomal protein L1 [Rhabdochlamydiaceae symbiont of Dictyostelium giganteum]|uniref:50S ribosomal protein L1 n=1 Tax=Rhabdochlamydiaceae symbiont of Dictyostelium giganteum TaxID=3342349 RepID=UPI00384F8042
MKSKRNREIAKLVNKQKAYKLAEAIEILKKAPAVKFDASVEIALKTGINAQKSDQQVRGVVSLPNGLGKKQTVLVFAKGDKVKEALDAGADYAGHDDLFEKVKGGWTDFDAVVATPDMMREVGKLGKILGPRSLMPSPKAGTVTSDVATAVKEIKAGRVEFKTDKFGVISGSVGKLSFSEEFLVQNIKAFVSAIAKAKPVTAKGVFLVSLAMSSTMGPGLKIDMSGLQE